MHEYGAAFYSYLESFAVCSAQRVVPVVAAALPVASVVDFGCGQGAWLRVWQDAGAAILGVDGPYVDRARLLISNDCFKPADLEFINTTVRSFLADVTSNWRKTQ